MVKQSKEVRRGSAAPDGPVAHAPWGTPRQGRRDGHPSTQNRLDQCSGGASLRGGQRFEILCFRGVPPFLLNY